MSCVCVHLTGLIYIVEHKDVSGITVHWDSYQLVATGCTLFWAYRCALDSFACVL